MTDTTAGEGGLAAQLRRRLEDLKGQFEKGRAGRAPHLRRRLEDPKGQCEKGPARLGQLEAEAGELRQTLTRIAGAIQVLEEELGRHDGGPGEPPAGP